MGVPGTSEVPDFNGLSGEGFHAGTDMLDVWQGLTPEQKKEVLPHLIDHLQASLIGQEFSAEDLRAMGQSFHSAAEAVDLRATAAEEQAKPFELTPEDDFQG